jgi:hypothetical protein
MLSNTRRMAWVLSLAAAVGCRIEAELPAAPGSAVADMQPSAAGGGASSTSAGRGSQAAAGRAAPEPAPAHVSSGAAGVAGSHARVPARAGEAAPPAAAGSSAPDDAQPSESDDDAFADDQSQVPPADSADGASGDGASAAGSPELPQADGTLPDVLQGSWYASSGYTSAPYDPATGTYGTPNGSALSYEFAADGSYRKTFQSYASNGGCSSGFTAFEVGVAAVSGNTLQTTPSSGHIQYSDSCAPSLDSDKPETDLSSESFSWEIVADGLLLTRSDGAASQFRRPSP